MAHDDIHEARFEAKDERRSTATPESLQRIGKRGWVKYRYLVLVLYPNHTSRLVEWLSTPIINV